VLIMHRLHEDDLAATYWTGAVGGRAPPAIADEAEHPGRDGVRAAILRPQRRVRALHPSASRPRCSSRSADYRRVQFRRPVPAMPAPQGGGMVKAAVVRTHAPNERPALFDRVCRAGTPPTRRPSSAISSVCTTWGITGKDLYLLHVLRKRMEYPN